jgi:acyl CoA:acetate/3-ketoacid CoA transferase beta subunit
VITSKAIFDFSPKERRMRLISVREGFSFKDVLDDMAFEPMVADKIDVLQAPRTDELNYLRDVIDPDRVVIGRIGK